MWSLKENWHVVSNMTWVKKYRGVIFHDTEQWCKIWRNPDPLVSKMAWGIGWTFIRAPTSLKIVNWIGLLWIVQGCFYPKHIMFQLENFRGIMNSCPIPWLKTLGWIFWKSSSPKMVCWRKLWFALSKFSQKIWRCLGTLAYLYFVWFVIFLNVMALQFCKWYLSNSVVLSLLPLLCNHSNLTLNLHQYK